MRKLLPDHKEQLTKAKQKLGGNGKYLKREEGCEVGESLCALLDLSPEIKGCLTN